MYFESFIEESSKNIIIISDKRNNSNASFEIEKFLTFKLPHEKIFYR